MSPYLALTLGILSRLVPSLLHVPGRNLTAVSASLLFFGSRRPARELLLPALLYAVTDVLLTTLVFRLPFHPTPYLLTWLWYLAIPLLGLALLRPSPTGRLRRGSRSARTASAVLLATGSFFLLSNGSVWLLSRLYPHTAAGLLACYSAGLPFLRNDILSTAVALPLFLAWPTRLPFAGRAAASPAESTPTRP